MSDLNGPIVVHFPTETMQIQVNSRRRSNFWYIIAIGFLLVLAMLFILWEHQGELTKSGLAMSLSKFTEQEQYESDTSNTVEPEPTPWQQQNPPLLDINDPPVPFDEAGIGSDEDDDDFDRKSLLYWEKHQNIPLKDSTVQGYEKKKTKTKKLVRPKKRRKKLLPFPVVEVDDDSVPQGVSGSVVHAADALLCRESVIDYVINATDLKDECDGLKKAFTKTCADESSSEDEAKEVPSATSDVSSGTNSQRRRGLLVADEYYAQAIERRNEHHNPLIYWQHHIHRLTHHIRQHQWLFGRPRPAFMADDAILMEWEEAPYQVEQNLDVPPPPIQGRKLAENPVAALTSQASSASRSSSSRSSSSSSTVSEAVAPANKTKPINVYKPKLSLELPTTNHHVSEKMLTETLMLQNEGKSIASAVKAAKNITNKNKSNDTTTTTTTTQASAYAAASNKAMSDTSEMVSAVLNDPTSVEARTCCTSILNVFHESCSADEEEEMSDKRLFIVVFVIAICGLVKSLIRHFHLRWLPEAAGCILVGACAGLALMYFPHHDISFDGNWFLRIMVPPIVFEAALSIDKRSFHRHGVPILIYAVIGTLVATALTALVVHKGSSFFRGCETIPLIEALTFGALISSIDPIAVLSVLNNMGMTDTDTIYILIFGESLLNDGVAIVLFETLVHFLDENIQVDGHAMAAASLHFLVVAIGSLVVGGLSGGCCTFYFWAMHGCQTPLVEVLMFFCWALLPYYICDGIEWSGIVAVVATGFVMDLYVVGQAGDSSTVGKEDDSSPQKLKSSPASSPRGKQQLHRRRRLMFSREGHLSGHAKTHIGFVTEILATTMETAIFAYLGLFLFNSRYHWNAYHTGLAILGCCLSRAIMIPMLSFLANSITRSQIGFAKCGSPLPQQSLLRGADASKIPPGVVIDRKMQLVLWFSGLRGAMSFALVENIPLYDAETGEGSRLKSELKAMTSACIFFTVFVLGGSTFYVMEMIGMAPVHGTNSSTKDTEMVGLLSKNLSGDDEDNDCTSSQGSLDFNHARDGKTPNIFRQRIQQAPA